MLVSTGGDSTRSTCGHSTDSTSEAGSLRASVTAPGAPSAWEVAITSIDAAGHQRTRPHPADTSRPRGFTPLDAALILLVTMLVRWFSGAQRLTFLHTPDSEFYFSLGTFGSAVTDRAPDDYYYWTKLGVVLPLRAFASFLPPLVALEVVQTLLAVIVASAAYAVARTSWSRPGACLAAAFASLNTVVLCFIGDPYASGAALAALSALLVTAMRWCAGDRPFRRRPAVLMGLLCAWLVMINPYALIVGAAGCAGVLLGNAGVVRQAGRRVLAGSAVSMLAAFAGGFLAFLALGRWAFPGLNWFTSLYAFVGSANLSAWAESDWRWAASDTTLLVPISVAVVALIAVRLTPHERSARTAAGLSVMTLVVTLVYKLVSQSNVLEVTVYNSMLWPAALLALILVAAATAEPRYGWMAGALAAAAPVAWVVAGHWSRELVPAIALAAAVGAVLAAAGLLRWARGGRVLVPRTPVLSAGLVLLTGLGCLFQVLQNGVPLYPTSTLSGSRTSGRSFPATRPPTSTRTCGCSSGSWLTPTRTSSCWSGTSP